MNALLFSLLLFAAVTTITPGGATTLAAASGLQFGFRRSIPLIAGIMVGLASLAAAAGGGLAALIASAPALQLGCVLSAPRTCFGWPGRSAMAAHPFFTANSR